MAYLNAANDCRQTVSQDAAQLIEKSTAFHTVRESLDEVSRIEGRLYAVMARLVGETPVNATATTSSPVQPGLLGELEDIGHSIKRSVYRMDEMLDSIQRALP